MDKQGPNMTAMALLNWYNFTRQHTLGSERDMLFMANSLIPGYAGACIAIGNILFDFLESGGSVQFTKDGKTVDWTETTEIVRVRSTLADRRDVEARGFSTVKRDDDWFWTVPPEEEKRFQETFGPLAGD